MPEEKTLENGIFALLEKNNYRDAYIRITISRGEGEPGLHPDLCQKPNMVIYAKPFSPHSNDWYTNGVKAVIVSTVKHCSGSIGIPLKSCNYLFNFLAKQEALVHGGLEGIMLSEDGSVAEGSVSNVFIVKDKIIKTPVTGEVVLDGVTRQCVLELASQKKIPLIEGKISADSLYSADECFLTNTTFEVLPVTTIGNKSIGDGTPGPISKLLGKLYKENLSRELFE